MLLNGSLGVYVVDYISHHFLLSRLSHDELSTLWVMHSTPSKRVAEQPPENERPAKKPMPSSPEEGELDDEDTRSPHSVNPPLPEPSTKPKVQFPFKPKPKAPETTPTLRSRLGVQEDRSGSVIYDRPMEDERGMYEEKARSRHGHDQHRRRQPPQFGGDHWEPNDRDRRLPREGYRHNHDFYRPRYHDRDRERSPPSMRSDRSLSPCSTPQRGKHRLPSHHHHTSIAFSPPQRDYGVDRLHDLRMRGEGWDRGRYGDDYGQDNRPFYHSDDRYYRPDRGPRRDRSHDRVRDPYDQERAWPDRAQDGDGGQTPRQSSYRPVSPDHAFGRVPGGDYYRPTSPRPPSIQPPSPSGAPPPPPPSSPPPVPPSYALKNDTLPPDHSAISIANPLKRPQAPRDAHSPSPYPLPPAREEDVRRAQEKKDAVGGEVPSKSVVAPQRRRREPVQRSRKEEMAVYGRSFEGCGRQSDYDATTKLGEGTFG